MIEAPKTDPKSCHEENVYALCSSETVSKLRRNNTLMRRQITRPVNVDLDREEAGTTSSTTPWCTIHHRKGREARAD